jgi:hypothetical protein
MTARPQRFALAAVMVVAVLTAACSGGGSAKNAAQTLRITSPARGTSVQGNVVSLAFGVAGITLVKADGDTSGRTGHFHVFVDREPVAAGQVIPKEAGIVHSAENPLKLTGLSVGRHRLVVVLGDGTHRRVGSARTETTVTVDGPSVDATAPATSAAGQPVVLTVKVEGVTLIKADGDASGRTGHLHVFVDRDPTAAGQPIPKEAGIIHTTDTTIAVPDLAPGEHTLWVVLGNGNHVPFAPAVLDKVTVTVT